MRHSKITRAISLFTVFALALTVCVYTSFSSGTASAAVTQADIDKANAKLDALGKELEELEAQLETVAGNKAKALEQKNLLDRQIATINAQIAQTDSVIAQYDELIAQKEAEIVDLKGKEELQYQLFCQQVRSMEEQGTVSYLSILFNSASFEELLDRTIMISEIMEYNNNIINLLIATREEVAGAQAELEGERAQQQSLRDEQAAAKAKLEVQRAQANSLVSQILSQEKAFEATRAQIEREEEAIQAEIVRLSKELAKQQQQNNNAALGGYIWPTDSHRITSPFGTRVSPTTGASTNHKGVDIGGVGYDSNVYAAKAGTVIISTKVSSYGQYIAISHGDGNVTLYAHLSSRKVSEGDWVEQGQVIGITGSTGISTGPHLHFEITENGVRVDPLKYLTNYTKAW